MKESYNLKSKRSGEEYELRLMKRDKGLAPRFVCNEFTKKSGDFIRFKFVDSFQRHIDNVG